MSWKILQLFLKSQFIWVQFFALEFFNFANFIASFQVNYNSNELTKRDFFMFNQYFVFFFLFKD